MHTLKHSITEGKFSPCFGMAPLDDKHRYLQLQGTRKSLHFSLGGLGDSVISMISKGQKVPWWQSESSSAQNKTKLDIPMNICLQLLRIWHEFYFYKR